MKRKIGTVFAWILVAFAYAGPALAQSAVFRGTFDANKISYAAANDPVKAVVAQTFSDVPDMVIFFDVASGQAVRVDFSASIASLSGRPLLLRMLFDEDPNVIIEPVEIRFDPGPALTHVSATFLLPLENGLAPGNHNVRIQWRSTQINRVVASHRTLVVEHN